MQSITYRLAALMALCLLLASPLLLFAKKDILLPLIATDSIKDDISFDNISVLDLRHDKSNCGTTMYGMGRRPILTADSLHLSLQKMIQDVVSTASGRQPYELLAVVQDIELKDVVKDMPTISSVYLRLDWYIGNAGHYTRVKETDSLYEFPAQRNPYAAVSFVTSYVLTEAVKEIAGIPAFGNFSLSMDDIIGEEAIARKKRAIYNMSPRKGIYYTEAQFLDGTPAEDDFIHNHYGSDWNKDEFHLAGTSGKKKGPNLAGSCYAIYDGEKWYRPYSETDFKQMKVQDGDFYYLAIQKGISLEDYSAVAGVGYSYGILGALISHGVAAIMDDRQHSKPIPYADALYRMRIDPVTGAGKRVERIR